MKQNDFGANLGLGMFILDWRINTPIVFEDIFFEFAFGWEGILKWISDQNARSKHCCSIFTQNNGETNFDSKMTKLRFRDIQLETLFDSKLVT